MDWIDVPLDDPGARPERFVEFPDNGYQLCILWAALTAGLEVVRVAATPDDDVETCIDRRTGHRTVTTGPRTQEDDETVDSFVNGYLDEADIPPRPRHHRWFLRSSDGLDSIQTAVRRASGRDDAAANVLQAALVVFGGTVLHGGGTTEVVKVGDRVIRSRRGSSARVEQLLVLLEERGFPRAPRFRGLTPDGRQILTYLDGRAGTYPLSPDVRSDEALVSAAHALRDLHAVTQDVAADLVGGWMLPDVAPYEVVCHGDFAPYNCVFRDRGLIGIIDFDTAHPGPRIRDVAYAVYRFGPLTAPGSTVGFGSVDEQSRRARLFCDAYGPVQREHLVDTLCDRLAELVAFMRAEAGNGDAAFRSHVRDGHDVAYLRDVEHLRRHRDVITTELLRG